MNIEVRLNNETGTRWTITVEFYTLQPDELIVKDVKGKTYHFPTRNILWWRELPEPDNG